MTKTRSPRQRMLDYLRDAEMTAEWQDYGGFVARISTAAHDLSEIGTTPAAAMEAAQRLLLAYCFEEFERAEAVTR